MNKRLQLIQEGFNQNKLNSYMILCDPKNLQNSVDGYLKSQISIKDT
jgi:hypothetical protein